MEQQKEEQKIKAEEEEEEEEEEDDLYYLESQPLAAAEEHQQQQQEEEEEEEEEEEDGYFYDEANTNTDVDESFYFANKTFYTTCHKISRQNSPTYRKKPPYSLLENWLIHSVFSKSQQILLRFPVIHPRVMMAEGDFIYTPHQIATENQDYYYDQQNYQDDDTDYDYYDDTFIIGDEGVMVMSASAPDASHFMAEDEDEPQHMVMDENMWMGHSRYNTLHVVNPDLDEEDPMYHSTYKPTNTPFQGQLQMVEEEDEEDEEDEAQQEQEQEEVEEEEEVQQEEEDSNNKPITMSPEVLEWYRSAELKPINEDCGCSSQEDQHSESSASTTRTDTLHSDEKSMTNESYTSLAEIMMEEETSRNYGALDNNRQLQQPQAQPEISPLLQVSACFVDAAWVALDLAQTYVEQDDKRGISGFITYMFRIWKVLFLGAETMLGWGNHRIRPQTVV